MSWIVYILECGDRSYYTGITNDFEARLLAHETGIGAKYTRGRGPFTLVYREECENRSMASRREIEIKALSRAAKKELLEFISDAKSAE